jgi:hypothetical protein
VLRRIFGWKRDEVTGGWRKLHDEKHHNLCSSPNVIRMMKSRRIKSSSTDRGTNTGFWREDLDVSGRIILYNVKVLDHF